MSQGMLVPAGDVDALATAMQCLAEDEPLRRRLSAQARVSAERFTAAEVMPRYVRLFAQSNQAGSIGHALPMSPS